MDGTKVNEEKRSGIRSLAVTMPGVGQMRRRKFLVVLGGAVAGPRRASAAASDASKFFRSDYPINAQIGVRLRGNRKTFAKRRETGKE